jgi:RNA polymerase sigma-70 factor (ECF subfamily)
MVDRLVEFDEQRPAMFGLAYRMLGVRADAEDVVQEAFLRWRSAAPEEIRSPRSYLMTVAARLSLDALKAAHRKRETYFGEWLAEPVVTETPDQAVEKAESLSLAFLHVLETLSPAERVAFLMREVFEESYEEVAQAIETSEENSRQLVARARKHLREKRPRFVVDRGRHEAVLYRFLTACASGDTEALFSMIKQDAIVHGDGGGKAPANVNPIYGADKIVRLMLGLVRKHQSELQGGYVKSINGQPGFVFTVGDQVTSVLTLDLDEDDRIQAIYFVANPEKLALGAL